MPSSLLRSTTAAISNSTRPSGAIVGFTAVASPKKNPPSAIHDRRPAAHRVQQKGEANYHQHRHHRIALPCALGPSAAWIMANSTPANIPASQSYGHAIATIAPVIATIRKMS